MADKSSYFGQPRQDDLLDYLQTLVGAGMDAADLTDLQIRLEPESSTSTIRPAIEGHMQALPIGEK